MSCFLFSFLHPSQKNNVSCIMHVQYLKLIKIWLFSNTLSFKYDLYTYVYMYIYVHVAKNIRSFISSKNTYVHVCIFFNSMLWHVKGILYCHIIWACIGWLWTTLRRTGLLWGTWWVLQLKFTANLILRVQLWIELLVTKRRYGKQYYKLSPGCWMSYS